MKLKQLEQHLQQIDGFDNPKILLGMHKIIVLLST